MITRDEAYTMLENSHPEHHLIQHALAAEAVMGELAAHFGEDQNLWSITGLLHDLDYPQTAADPAQHGLRTAEQLAGMLPDDALNAIRAHNSECNGFPVGGQFDIALRCGETVTGLISAAALVRPTGMEGMQVSSLKKKMKDKAFAASVNRDIIKQCAEIGLSLEEFLQLAINAMTPHAAELGLVR